MRVHIPLRDHRRRYRQASTLTIDDQHQNIEKGSSLHPPREKTGTRRPLGPSLRKIMFLGSYLVTAGVAIVVVDSASVVLCVEILCPMSLED